jgi:4,4'-diaponeurosporenoate glycosyltransferase
VVIPARDEEVTLGDLLDSIAASTTPPREIVVVDDGSTDGTADLARRRGIRVVPATPPPAGWTGKTWACATGVEVTSAPVVVLVDADVRLHPRALAALVGAHSHRGGLISVLPEHRPERAHEQLSAPFNLVSVMGTGAALPGRDGRTELAFGPCMVVDRSSLEAIGGFASVAAEVVEDVALARRFVAADQPVHAFSGGDLVWFRMYPAGVRQLLEGWTKNVAGGATNTPPVRSLAIAAWVASGLAPAAGITSRRRLEPRLVLAAAASALQFTVLMRRVGRFRWWTGTASCPLLTVFSALFVRSCWHRFIRRRTTWKGRTVRL